MAELASPSKRAAEPVPVVEKEKPAALLASSISAGQHSWATGLDQAGTLPHPASVETEKPSAAKEPSGGCTCTVQ